VGGTNQSIPRRSLRSIDFTPKVWLTGVPFTLDAGRLPLAEHGFMMTDDVGFGKDGTPADPTDATGLRTANNNPRGPLIQTVQKDGRYSWAMLLRRPRVTNWDQADLTVVLYQGRSVDGPTIETACTANFTDNYTEVTLQFAGTKPSVRKGTWILDATM